MSSASHRCRTIGCRVGVALFERDVFRWNADLARQDLSEGRRVSLALADRAEPRDGTPSRMYPDLARIEHAKAKDVAILDRAGGTISVKKLTPMPIKFADLAAREGFAIAPLLVAQTVARDLSSAVA